MTVSRSTVLVGAMERVILGVPAAEAVLEEAERHHAKRVFVLTSDTLRRETDEIGKIEQALGPRHAATQSGIRPHAPKSDLVAATQAALAVGTDLIVAVGGGSITDGGKILGLALRHRAVTVEGLDALRIRYDDRGQITARPEQGPEVRTICVPTTLSGAEFNTLSGAYDEDLRQKQGYQHALMAPLSVVLDPQIVRHTPAWLWLSTGIRAVDHAVETLVSPYSNAYYDGLAESGLKLLAAALPKTHRDPGDDEARLNAQIGAWQAIIPLVGGVPMGASHAIGHALGGHCGIPHGYTSCVMAAAVQRWNAELGVPGHRRVAASLGDPEAPVGDLLRHLIVGLGLPHSLSAVGVAPEHYDRLAELTLHDIWGGTNVRKLAGAADVVTILRMAQT
jgi:alcohol dehydrogenase class IV